MSEEIVVEKKHKAKYKSALRSIKLIKDAYIALMHEKKSDKITVSDIVKKANLNRGTFYAHYKKTSDIKKEIENEIIEQINSTFEDFNFNDFLKNPTPLLKKTEKILNENLNYYKDIMCFTINVDFLQEIKNILLEKFTEDTSVQEHIKKSPQFIITLEFLVGGMITVFTSYVQGNIFVTDNNITESLSLIISSRSQLFLETKIRTSLKS